MCLLYSYNNVKLLRKFFYINICGFIGSGKFLYETRVLDNICVQFKFKLPTSESTQITAGGPKVPIEGFFTPRRPLAEKNIFVLNACTLPYLIVILVSIF